MFKMSKFGLQIYEVFFDFQTLYENMFRYIKMKVSGLFLLCFFFFPFFFYGQNRNDSIRPIIKIHIDRKVFKEVPLKKGDSPIAPSSFPFAYLKADSIVKEDNIYHIYYSGPQIPDSVVFISPKKLPDNVSSYYNRYIKTHINDINQNLNIWLAADFFYADKIRLVGENSKKILFIKGEYKPGGSLNADISLRRMTQKVKIQGLARMDLHNIFSGNDHFRFFYHAFNRTQQFIFNYKLKYIKGSGLHWGAGFAQFRSDSLVRTEFQTTLYWTTPHLVWTAGVEKHIRQPSSTLLIKAGLQFRKQIKKSILKAAVFTRFHQMQLSDIFSIAEWKINSMPYIETKIFFNKSFSGNINFNLQRYADIFTTRLFSSRVLYDLLDAKIKISYPVNNLEFYVSSRYLQISPAQKNAIHTLINSFGTGFFNKNTLISLEISHLTGDLYISDNQRFVFVIKQTFKW